MNQNTQNPKLLLQIPFAKSESAPHAKISVFESIIFLIMAESPSWPGALQFHFVILQRVSLLHLLLNFVCFWY